MPSVNLRIPTDDVVRRDSERILAEPRLTMTSAVNIFQRAVVRENGMPFGLNSDVPNAETAAAHLRNFGRSARDIGRSCSSPYLPSSIWICPLPDLPDTG